MTQVKKKILIAEDDKDISMVLAMRLKFKGYDVIQAYNGEDAWNLINDNPPNLAVIDMIMPKMNGDELCDMIKKDDKTKNIILILLTALPQKEAEALRDKFNINTCITKPYDDEDFINVIENLLSESSMEN